MSFPVSQAQAEIEYRQERISSSFGGGSASPGARRSVVGQTGRRLHVRRRPSSARLS